MIKKMKEISHSWGTETILTLDGGSIVRLYASEKKVTVQVAKAEEGDAVILPWQDKYPSPTITKVLGGLEEHKAAVAKLVHWFNQSKPLKVGEEVKDYKAEIDSLVEGLVKKVDLIPQDPRQGDDGRCTRCGAVWTPPPSLMQDGCAKCWV